MFSIEAIIFGTAILLLGSVLLSKVSTTIGIPSLVFFLIIGMFAGTEGIGRLDIVDPWRAQFIGVIALSFILYSGGLETEWRSMRPVLWNGISLSTIGVLVSTVAVGGFASWLLHIPFAEGLLLGAIISSTDAAAVFSILTGKNSSIKESLEETIALESGTNDPMAVFITLGMLSYIKDAEFSALSLVMSFVLQMSLGVAGGLLAGRLLVFTINKLRLESDGLYPVLSIAFVLLTYGAITTIHGSGFLALYVAGVYVGNSTFYHKRSLVRFHTGLAWLVQIMMFLILGLLVVPSDLLAVAGLGVLLSLFLMLIARPLGVFASLARSTVTLREKVFISWVGLRGAVPIVLATFPLLEGLPHAHLLFNLVFFIVLGSLIVQTISIPPVLRYLGIQRESKRHQFEREYGTPVGESSQLIELFVPFNATSSGKTLLELHLPADVRVMLISRDEGAFVPNGNTRIEEGDVLMMMMEPKYFATLQEMLR